MRENENKNDFVEMFFKPIVIKYAIFSFVASILIAIFYDVPLVQNSGFFVRLISVLFGVVLGTIGGMLGVVVKAVYVPNTSSFLGDLFWTIGPQAVGVILGSIFGVGTFLYILA